MKTTRATTPTVSLATLFFGAYRREVLRLLLLQPHKSYHLRELARVTKTQPGTLRRELKLLVEAGIIECNRTGQRMHYRARRSCPIYDELRNILRKTDSD